MSRNDSGDPILLKVEEAAKLLQVSRDTIYEMVHRGEMPHIKIGRIIRIPRTGLERWVTVESGLPDKTAGGVHFPQRRVQQH